eukprot:EG_transcript_20347
MSTLLDLPADALLHIADLLWTSALPLTCWRLCALLHRRHVKLNCVSGRNVTRKFGLLAEDPPVRTLTILCSMAPLPPPQCAALLPAPRLSALQTLRVVAFQCDLRGGVAAFATLRDLPSLHSLWLELPWNNIDSAGARSLSLLKDAPRLERLTLGLLGNHVMDAGANALAALGESASLRRLELDLRLNAISKIGVAALQQLKAPQRTGGLQMEVDVEVESMVAIP